jgi:hypothetical protein
VTVQPKAIEVPWSEDAAAREWDKKLIETQREEIKRLKAARFDQKQLEAAS